MEQFLDTFGLGHLKNDFTKHNIDSTDLLRFMSQDQIRQIIPNIGDQIRFQRGIREIAVETQVICETEDQVEVPIELSAKKQKVDESDVDNKSDSTVTDLDNSECGLNSSFLSIASSSEPLIAQLNIKSILEADFIGKAILRKHEKCSSIDNRDRNNISEIIVTYFLNRAYKLNNTSLKAIASKIVDVFPTENKNTYFVSPVPKRKSLENKPIVAKGKLVDKQRNKLTALRRSLEFQERGGESVLPETFNDAVSAAAKDGQLWLRSNSEPHEDVLKYWEQSYPIRKLASNKTKTIEIFYTEWPILGTQIAIELINFDFEKQFKQNKIDITCIFQDFFDDILELKRKNLSGADETFLNLSAGDITRDSKTAIQLYLLAALIPPKGRCRVAGKHWKPSVAECRDGFLLYVKAPGDIDEARAKRIDLMYKKGLTVQPYLLIVGPDKLECLSQNCHRIFSNISSFKKHLLSQHKDLSESPISESVLQEVIPEVTNSSSRSEIVIEDLKYNSESEVYNYSFSGDMRKQILAFIANLYSISSLPRNIVQKVMDGLTELLLTMIAGISETAKNMENGLPEKLVEAFHDIQDILSSLRSEFKRFKYFESSESFIKPKTFLIGERIVADKSGIPNQSALNIKKAEGQLIPLSKVLQKFLELPNVYDTITDYMNKQMTAPPTYLCSIFQGSLWKNIRSQFDVNKILFPIFLYFDDFESCNPLGSKAGLHKIGAVYISLACIPPEYATLLENIHMGQLFYSDDRSFYGNQKIFSKLLNDLYKLEIEGISITKNSKKVNIHFVVLLILGDNLGMNSILGFQESFQSTYFCRICRTSKEDSKTQTLENYTTLRSPENYVDDSEELSHGIKETCIFHKLPSFHVTENISVDLMHDVLEGILRYDLARILNYLIGKKYFNLELLNNRIKFFDFSEIDLGNTVPLIKHESLKKNYIVLSASEMLSFVAFLGILIGDLVPEDDDCWILYINLHQIMQILLSRTITLDTVEHLQMLIEEHHSIYCELFNDTLKPKHHFLLHYPGIIKKVGPPRYFWAMRYEACHKILKSTADAVTSRKNILFTIALKFQLRFSYRLISERGISLDISYGHCDDIHSFTNFDEFKQLFDSIGVCLYSNNSFCTSWIKINNIIYKCGVVVHVSDIEYPQFGIIHNILSVNSSIYFIVQPLKTVGLNFHLQAYEVEFLPRRRIKEMILTLVDNLIDKMPSNIHYSGNGLKVIGIL